MYAIGRPEIRVGSEEAPRTATDFGARRGVRPEKREDEDMARTFPTVIDQTTLLRRHGRSVTARRLSGKARADYGLFMRVVQTALAALV
jgi:hypothetical protein